MGILIIEDNVPHLMHASSAAGAVVLEKTFQYTSVDIVDNPFACIVQPRGISVQLSAAIPYPFKIVYPETPNPKPA